jgi:DNA-binding PadR family transcriptional regulator
MVTASQGKLGRNANTGYLILSSLAGGSKHGYALVQDIDEFAGVRLSPGTLYEALARLESSGWIEALDADERRRPYRLTSEGVTALADHLTAQSRLVKVGQTRLRLNWSVA